LFCPEEVYGICFKLQVVTDPKPEQYVVRRYYTEKDPVPRPIGLFLYVCNVQRYLAFAKL
jgi:hypothetical protein